MPCVACTYMPNASWRRRGGKAQGRGISHPEQGVGRAKRRSAQAKRGRLLGYPCAAPGRRPQRGLASLFALVRAPDFGEGVAGRNSPQRCGRAEPQGLSAGGGLLLRNCVASGGTIGVVVPALSTVQSHVFGRWLGTRHNGCEPVTDVEQSSLYIEGKPPIAGNQICR